MSIRKLAVLFTIFLASVIILADLGYLRFILRMVSRVEYLDKVLHFLLVGILAFLVIGSLLQTFASYNLSSWITIASITVIAFIFTIEELLQRPIRGRDFSLQDLAANYLGIFVFGFLAWWRYGKVKQETISK